MGAPFTPTQQDNTRINIRQEDLILNDWVDDQESSLWENVGNLTESSIDQLITQDALTDKTEIGPASTTTMDYIQGTLEVGGIINPGADLVNSVLYLLQGEFGEAAWSLGAVIPGVGEARKSKKAIDAFVDGRKILDEAIDAGEEIVTVHRGVGSWHRGSMVKEGRYISGKGSGTRMGSITDDAFYTSLDFDAATGYTLKNISGTGRKKIYGHLPTSRVLEFQVPRSYIEKHGVSQLGNPSFKEMEQYRNIIFPGGLPKGFLVNVNKNLSRTSKHVPSRKVIDKNLRHGSDMDDGLIRLNQRLDDLGKGGNYINTRTIKTEGGEFIVKHTDETVSIGARDAVIVEITNKTTGKKTYQPFYRSTGTGAPEMGSKGNWLPFEGIIPRGQTNPISIKIGPNKTTKYRGPSEKWSENFIDGNFRPDIISDGWLVKAFKNNKNELIDSSILETKRGLPVHKEIDSYLRGIFN